MFLGIAMPTKRSRGDGNATSSRKPGKKKKISRGSKKRGSVKQRKVKKVTVSQRDHRKPGSPRLVKKTEVEKSAKKKKSLKKSMKKKSVQKKSIKKKSVRKKSVGKDVGSPRPVKKTKVKKLAKKKKSSEKSVKKKSVKKKSIKKKSVEKKSVGEDVAKKRKKRDVSGKEELDDISEEQISLSRKESQSNCEEYVFQDDLSTLDVGFGNQRYETVVIKVSASIRQSSKGRQLVVMVARRGSLLHIKFEKNLDYKFKLLKRNGIFTFKLRWSQADVRAFDPERNRKWVGSNLAVYLSDPEMIISEQEMVSEGDFDLGHWNPLDRIHSLKFKSEDSSVSFGGLHLDVERINSGIPRFTVNDGSYKISKLGPKYWNFDDTEKVTVILNATMETKENYRNAMGGCRVLDDVVKAYYSKLVGELLALHKTNPHSFEIDFNQYRSCDKVSYQRMVKEFKIEKAIPKDFQRIKLLNVRIQRIKNTPDVVYISRLNGRSKIDPVDKFDPKTMSYRWKLKVQLQSDGTEEGIELMFWDQEMINAYGITAGEFKAYSAAQQTEWMIQLKSQVITLYLDLSSVEFKGKPDLKKDVVKIEL